MSIIERIRKIKESLLSDSKKEKVVLPSLRNKAWSYAANSYHKNYTFSSGYEEGKKYTIIKNGTEVEGSVGFRGGQIKEFINSSLAFVPNIISIREATIYVEPNKGGQIVFSTEINAVLKDKDGNDIKEPIIPRIKRYVHAKTTSILNRLFSRDKLKKILDVDKEVFGYSIGNFFHGRYRDRKGNFYDESSMSVEIVGITSEVLKKLAEAICIDFNQDSVLVKDYATGEIMFLYKDSKIQQL